MYLYLSTDTWKVEIKKRDFLTKQLNIEVKLNISKYVRG